MTDYKRHATQLITLVIFLLMFSCSASRFQKKVDTYRVEYKNKFELSSHAPLKGEQLKDMRFYPANSSFLVKAQVVRNPIPVPFDVTTSSGMIKQFHKFADLKFELNGRQFTLEVYQNLKIIKNPGYKNYLFLPFNDLTNGDSTYGGGRYIDLEATDIKNDKVWIDFNKCYNPYCAYSAGYNCPIPPAANNLDIAITAGEKLYVGEYIGESHE